MANPAKISRGIIFNVPDYGPPENISQYLIDCNHYPAILLARRMSLITSPLYGKRSKPYGKRSKLYGKRSKPSHNKSLPFRRKMQTYDPSLNRKVTPPAPTPTPPAPTPTPPPLPVAVAISSPDSTAQSVKRRVINTMASKS